MTEPTIADQADDDSDVGWGERPSSADEADARLLAERPPHHEER